MTPTDRTNAISTSSVDDGLDFACHLLATDLLRQPRTDRALASSALQDLAQYIQYRYVGEQLLALEQLLTLNQTVGPRPVNAQFCAQVIWLIDAMELTADQRRRLPPLDA